MSCFDYEYVVGSNLKNMLLLQKVSKDDLKLVWF